MNPWNIGQEHFGPAFLVQHPLSRDVIALWRTLHCPDKELETALRPARSLMPFSQGVYSPTGNTLVCGGKNGFCELKAGSPVRLLPFRAPRIPDSLFLRPRLTALTADDRCLVAGYSAAFVLLMDFGDPPAQYLFRFCRWAVRSVCLDANSFTVLGGWGTAKRFPRCMKKLDAILENSG